MTLEDGKLHPLTKRSEDDPGPLVVLIYGVMFVVGLLLLGAGLLIGSVPLGGTGAVLSGFGFIYGLGTLAFIDLFDGDQR